jgi:hypothetical protein
LDFYKKLFQGHIEQKILMDNYEAARRIMEKGSPPNCFAVCISFSHPSFPIFFP